MFVKKSLILLAVAAALAACSSNQTERSSVSGQEKGVQPLTKRPAFDAAAESVASSGFNANTNVQAFIKYEAAKGRFKEADLRDFSDNAVYKGNIISAGSVSPYSLYSEEFVTFGEDDVYNQQDAEGFINLFGLPLKMRALMLQAKKK